MVEKVDAAKFLNLARSLPVIDVRSPGEFLQGHVPGAISFPLFDDEERAIVGTIYKNSGRESAVLKGFELAGPKLAGFIKKMNQLALGRDILLHCWRGGLRSGQMAWLFDQAGFRVRLLEGGYKAYRRFIRSAFLFPSRIVVLGGMTGSGKTEILHALGRSGEQVLDLEMAAHHKGSVFGGLGQSVQPTNEQFENDVADQWLRFDLSKRIWLEDESRSIGNVIIPDPLFDRMDSSPLVRIGIPVSERIERIVKEYGNFPKEQLNEAIGKISEKLGGTRTRDAMQAVSDNKISEAARLSLEYYDKTYGHSVSRRKGPVTVSLQTNTDDPGINALIVRQWADENLF